MKNKALTNFASAVLTIVLGVFLCIFKSSVVSIAITVLGVVLLLMGAISLIKTSGKNAVADVVKMIIGVVAIVFAWVLTAVAFIVLGVVVLVYGVMQLLNVLKQKKVKALDLVSPILVIICGLGLLFGKLAEVIFIVIGVVLIIQGILALVNISTKKK